ncbi:MAG: hypothetical protein JW795_23415 [Chitinivibrionales bacterium]|nr:hypothetical protein [Chitinivibrionales bacterium]
MKQTSFKVLFLLTLTLQGVLLFPPSLCRGQIVPFFPTEVFFTPIGFTNAIVGTDPKLYTPFSHLKVGLTKDVVTTEKYAFTVDAAASCAVYHHITKARDYIPLFGSGILRSHYFFNDIFTLGLELTAMGESLPGADSLGMVFHYNHYTLKVQPFFYLAVTPNLILQQLISITSSVNKGFEDRSPQQANDYTLQKFELIVLYFTPYNTRFFGSPYLFSDRYLKLSAPAANGKQALDNPPLRETGFGIATGARYEKSDWGYAEAACEYERNIDRIFGGNDYQKLKVSAGRENQFYRQWFGFMLMGDVAYYLFPNIKAPLNPKNIDQTNPSGEVNQWEARLDVMPIYNINRNVSIRPEFDMIYRKKNSADAFRKYRFWLHLHILL